MCYTEIDKSFVHITHTKYTWLLPYTFVFFSRRTYIVYFVNYIIQRHVQWCIDNTKADLESYEKCGCSLSRLRVCTIQSGEGVAAPKMAKQDLFW